MQRVNTTAIVLARRDYGEADRIVTFLTQDKGKLSTLVKGARRPKSRMAGGIELFSITNLTYLESHKDLKTIVGAELKKHYGRIVSDIDRTMWAYEILKLMNRTLPESSDETQFDLLQSTLENLENRDVPLWATELSFYVEWLRQHGQQIRTDADARGNALIPGEPLIFSFEDKGFVPGAAGRFNDQHIKLLRLAERYPAVKLAMVQQGEAVAKQLQQVLMMAANTVV